MMHLPITLIQILKFKKHQIIAEMVKQKFIFKIKIHTFIEILKFKFTFDWNLFRINRQDIQKIGFYSKATDLCKEYAKGNLSLINFFKLYYIILIQMHIIH